jgi:hypothetical protein
MAASAPIQFTVDQTALQEVGTVAKPSKRRRSRLVPAPMMEGIPTRSATSDEDSDDQHVEKLAVLGQISPKASPKKGRSHKMEDVEELDQNIFDERVIACSLEVSCS